MLVRPRHDSWRRFGSIPAASTSRAGTAMRPLRVVAIGGGTGLSTLLRGLRRHVARPAQPVRRRRRSATWPRW